MKQAEVKKYRKIYTNEEIEKFVNLSIDQLRSDADVYAKIKELGVKTSQVKDYLPLFLDFQEDFNACKNCKGLSECPKARKHMKLSLKVDDERIERQLTLCDYALDKMELDKNYLYCDFPEAWKNNKFSDLQPLKIRSNIINACVDVLEQKNDNWLYVVSNRSNGKSHILVSFVNSLIALNRGPVAVIDCSLRINEFLDMAINEKETFNNELNKLINVPVLFLDNFGDGSKSDFVLNTILYPLLAERGRKGLLTLFAGAYKITEIGELFASGSKNKQTSSLTTRRLTSLLTEMCQKEIYLEGVPVHKKTIA